MAMTKQQIMDKVALHLITQGKPSINDVGDCLYRAPDGSSCAVGYLIEDAAYQPHFESHVVSRCGDVRYALVVSGVMDEVTDADAINFLSELQRAHDIGSDWPKEKWLDACVEALLATCRRYQLEIPDCITDYYR